MNKLPYRVKMNWWDGGVLQVADRFFKTEKEAREYCEVAGRIKSKTTSSHSLKIYNEFGELVHSTEIGFVQTSTYA